MTKLFTTIAFSIAVFAASAQTKITGKITDTKGRILPGASVTIKNSYDGANADSLGNFSFKTFEKDSQVVVVTVLGYKDAEQPIFCNKADVNLSFSLKEKLDELKAVTVTAGSFEAGDKKRAATVLSSLDVVTTGGANADITSAIKTLPGAQQIGEQEGLFVRGGAGYETKQFIDGTVVNNPFNASAPDIASRGRFSPFLFKGTVFSTGGYSAVYGQALSSALILESIDIPDKTQVSASISSVFIGAGAQQVAEDKKSSWGINYGYTNLLPYFAIVKQKPDYFHIPEFHNVDANFRIKTKQGIIKFYTAYGATNFGLRRPNIDNPVLKNAFGLKNYNLYNNLSWRESLGNGWKLNVGLGYSTNKDILSQQIQNANNVPTTTNQPWIDGLNFDINAIQDLTQAKVVLDKRISGISVIRFGAENWYAVNKSTVNKTPFVLKDNLTSAFAEADLYITNDIAAKMGVRSEYSSVIQKANVAPRMSVAYKTGKNAQMSLIYGEFFQKPENNNLFTSATNLGYVRASHYMMNYIRNSNDRNFRVEAYYKKYHDLITNIPSTGLFENGGSGYAKGIELFWRDRKTVKGVDYWISYSYLDTKRKFNNYPTQLTPTFGAAHTASLVVKRYVPSINTGFNFTYSFATGRPYYNIQQQAGKYVVADEGRTIAYNNLGFSLNYLTTIAKSYAVIVASVTNVFNSKQIFGYSYTYDGSRKEAIVPPAPQFFFIGAFLSWGVDRRQDAINNNL